MHRSSGTNNHRAEAAKLLTVLVSANSTKATELVQTLEVLGQQLEASPGCLECVVAREISGAPRFVLFLAFRDLQSLEAQLTSDKFRILRGAMNVLSEPAEFRIATANSALGFSP